jgi:hypothetical protein
MEPRSNYKSILIRFSFGAWLAISDLKIKGTVFRIFPNYILILEKEKAAVIFSYEKYRFVYRKLRTVVSNGLYCSVKQTLSS